MTNIALATHLDRFVRRLHVQLTERATQFDPDKVGPGGAILLLTLSDMGTAPFSAVAARLIRDKSQLTREVASLERKGMIARAPCPDDARSQLLSLTEKGEGLVRVHKGALAEILDEMMVNLSSADKEALTRLLLAVAP
ncbi:MAG: MarR family transcriptional regulator [Pseudomonadota bacterium]